ncbi:hypothetical protein L218DRAFT_1076730 [Marasmius fiardii PR-910]|nr:hypothetical protein L218DRAFT_1076730 [Marasmius fiardii PR-910]
MSDSDSVSTSTSSSSVLCISCNDLLAARASSVIFPVFPSHHVFSKSEITQTLSVLQNAERILESYDEGISRLRSILTKREAEKHDLYRKIESCRGSISALNRFPPEIWHKIFNSVFSSPTDWSLSISGSDVQAIPMTLSHVCSRWRYIIQTMPEMWCSIRVNLTDPIGSTLNLLDLYTSNSKEQPLRISFWQSYEARGYKNDLDKACAFFGENGLFAFQKLMKEITRCSELQVDVSWDIMSIVVRSEELSLPQLRTLHARHPPPESAIAGPSMKWFSDSIQQAPLSKLYLGSLPAVMSSLPYHKVRTMVIDDIDDPPSVARLLSVSASLEKLDARVSSAILLLAQSDITISESLRDLTLRFDGPSVHDTRKILLPLFTSVTLPSLVSLKLAGSALWFASDEEGFLAIGSMIERSQCPLRTLVLHLPLRGSHLPGLKDLLRRCHELTELELVGIPPYGDERMGDSTLRISRTLHSLLNKSQDVLLPQLKRLVLHVGDPGRWRPHESDERRFFVELLRSRTWSGVSSLRDVHLIFHSGAFFADLQLEVYVPDSPLSTSWAGSDQFNDELHAETQFLRSRGIALHIEHRRVSYCV